jgi:hypothetical protein
MLSASFKDARPEATIDRAFFRAIASRNHLTIAILPPLSVTFLFSTVHAQVDDS